MNRSVFHCIRDWCLVALIVAGGCSSVSIPWVESDSTGRTGRYGAKDVIVVGEFANPSLNPTGWTDIGRQLANNIRQKLGARGDLEVCEDPTLVARGQSLAIASQEHRATELKAISKQWPGVRFVLNGSVVDFRHVTHSPTDLAKWDSSRNRAQAIVTVKVEIYDLQQRRRIASDQIEAGAWADQTPFEQTYRGMSFGSNRFWTTPLGLASRDVIAQCAKRFDEVAPMVHEPAIRIVSKLSDRRIRLNIDSKSRVQAGDIMWVCQYDASGTRLQPVLDPATRQPVRAKVESRGVLPSAWLLGEPPADMNLTRAILLATKPN